MKKTLLSILAFVLLICCFSACGQNDSQKEYQAEANVVINLIESLPNLDELQLSDEGSITITRNAYNNLSEGAKPLVTNIDVLTALEERLLQLKFQASPQEQADAVMSIISSLPPLNELQLSDETLLVSARNSYNNLIQEAKPLVTNLDDLVVLEEKMQTLKQQAVYQQEANGVIEQIANLPEEGALQLTDEAALINARNSFNNLSEGAKALVDNLSKLTLLENKMVELKSQQDTQNALQQEASGVIQMIDNLPEESVLQLSDELIVSSARCAYENLSQDAKPYVTNLRVLVALEQKILQLKNQASFQQQADVVISLINDLPTEADLQLSHEAEINNARTSYENLSQDAKSLVSNLNTLVELENKLSELKQQALPYEVKLYSNGGVLDGLDLVGSAVTKAQLKINYFSTGYWSVYKTDVVLFKTGLFNAEDTYTYALKVGINYNQVTNIYEVVQIVANGTALSSANKTSEYYLIVHSDNASAYSSLSNAVIGDVVDINKSLPSSASTTLNADVVIKTNAPASDSYYLATYTGTVNLPIPIMAGFNFEGWYLSSSFSGSASISCSSAGNYYAKWAVNSNNLLDCVSNVATSNTVDNLVTSVGNVTYTWSSSNNNLYNVSGGVGKVSKVYQTHKTQTVTISVKGSDGSNQSKTITVNPVLFATMPNTPVATYFHSGSASAYRNYNDRYKQDGTYFSEQTKSTLDIVYYAFAIPNSDGTLSLQNASDVEILKPLKANDVRMIVSVNGVSEATSLIFRDLCGDDTKRANFIKNMMDMVEQYNFDGIDIDWESATSSSTVIAASMSKLMVDLREEMTKRQSADGTPYFLSAAVPASSWGLGADRFDFVTLNNYVDYINLMSYDLNNREITSHVSPMYSSNNDGGYGFGCYYGLEKLSEKGLDKSKVIIGCAGYGKTYSVTGALGGTYPSLGKTGTLTAISGVPGSFSSGTVYGNGINYLINTGRYTKYTEYNNANQIVGSFLYSSTDNIFVTYDSTEVVMAKYNYVKDISGAGIMCWSYTEDTSDTVINAITQAKNS